MPTIYHKTPLGIAKIIEEDNFITCISILDEAVPTQVPGSDMLREAIKQLNEYFAGERKDFDFPIKQQGTDFQRSVWDELSKIEYGKTITYSQQSSRMNTPLAIRAIASANGKNNLWVVVPCHRVIGADGSLTGYAGGLWRKQWLLEHEAKILGVGQTKLAF